MLSGLVFRQYPLCCAGPQIERLLDHSNPCVALEGLHLEAATRVRHGLDPVALVPLGRLS